MKFSMLGVTKLVATGVVGMGVNKVVAGVIKNHVTVETLFDKVAVTAATWVITGIAVSRSEQYVSDHIDDVVATGHKVVDKFKLEAKLGRIIRKESTFEQEGLDQNDFVKNPKNGRWQKKTIVESETDAEHIRKVNDITNQATTTD